MWLLGIELRTFAGLLQPKDLFIVIYIYTIAVFRHARRGCHMDGCELPCGCWDLNSGPLEEQSVLLPAEPSLQPQSVVLKFLV
jgi:hypothetical protein